MGNSESAIRRMEAASRLRRQELELKARLERKQKESDAKIARENKESEARIARKKQEMEATLKMQQDEAETEKEMRKLAKEKYLKDLSIEEKTLELIEDAALEKVKELGADKKNNCVLDKSFGMNEYPREIAGQLLSQIEESVPLSDINRHWITQQIVHAVGNARTGLSNHRRQVEKHSVQQVKATGKDLKITVHSWTFSKDGKTIKADKTETISIRFVIALQAIDRPHQVMDQQVTDILQRKAED